MTRHAATPAAILDRLAAPFDPDAARAGRARTSLAALAPEYLTTLGRAIGARFSATAVLEIDRESGSIHAGWFLEIGLMSQRGAMTILFPAALVEKAAKSLPDLHLGDDCVRDELTAVFLAAILGSIHASGVRADHFFRIRSIRYAREAARPALRLVLRLFEEPQELAVVPSEQLAHYWRRLARRRRKPPACSPALQENAAHLSVTLCCLCADLSELTELAAGKRLPLQAKATAMISILGNGGARPIERAGRWAIRPGDGRPMLRFAAGAGE